MSPESLEGQTDHRSDIYGLGLTLYELVTLRPAFQGPTPMELLRKVGASEVTPPQRIDRQVPRDLATILLKSIARLPAHRYQSANDLAEDLQRFLDDRPIRARRNAALGKSLEMVQKKSDRRGLVGRHTRTHSGRCP